MDDVLLARLQMALSLGFHIIFAVIGIGMPLLMAIAEYRWLRTCDGVYIQLAKRWAKGTAIFFAVGAVSGTVLSFELGLLWPRFMEHAGGIIGFPFSLEGFAFFTEGIFLGIYLYGWKRVHRWAHWGAGVVVAVSGAASAMSKSLAGSWWMWPLQIATGVAAAGAIAALIARRFLLARALAVAQVTLIVLGYGAALFPYLVVPDFTIEGTASPARTHRLVLGALAAGAAILLPSLYYLYRIFKGRRAFAIIDTD